MQAMARPPYSINLVLSKFKGNFKNKVGPPPRNSIPGFDADYVATIGNNGAVGIRNCTNGE